MAKKKKKKWLWLTIVVLLLVFIGSYFLNSSKDKDAIKVTTAKVSKRNIVQTVTANGKIQPETEVKISSQTSGEIIYLGVKEGDTVKTGQLLVRIKPDIIDAQLKQMRAAADAAKMDITVNEAEKERSEADLIRISDLYKKEFVSKQEFETAKATAARAVGSYQSSIARYQQALASLAQIEREQDRTSIYSPISGVITLLSVELGEKVVGTGMMAGTEMMRVADLSVMNAVVDVDENDIVLVKRGDTASIEIDAIPDAKFIGEVIEMGHSAKESQLGTADQVTNFEVKIRLIDRDDRLRPGMSCNSDISTESKYNVLAVPLQAVTVRENKTNKESDSRPVDVMPSGNNENTIKKVERPPSVVFLNDNKTAKMVQVETGISDNGFIEITSGLNENDEIISGSYMAVSRELRDGSKIMIDTTKTNNFQMNK